MCCVANMGSFGKCTLVLDCSPDGRERRVTKCMQLLSLLPASTFT
jgi:hypothetical protein